MKQTINLGSAVDDSTGDYLRQGGLKINENFENVYDELGDGSALHPAGAWHTHTYANGASLTPELGGQYNVNSLGGGITVTLPKGSPADYGRVIKLRDVHASWGTNSIAIKPTSGDSLGGSTNPVLFGTDFTTLEFVYSSPATWRYISNMKLDSLPKSDGAGVIVATFRVTTANYADGFFTNISAGGYNATAVQVYRNGSLLTYNADLANTDYGSRSTTGNTIVALNGVDIFIPYVIDGDIVTIISYSKDVSAAPVSYVRIDIQMLDVNNPAPAVNGQSLKIKSSGVYSLTDLGRSSAEEYNPNATQILLNGTLLVPAGSAGLNPGATEDYKLSADVSGAWNTFTVTPAMTDGDILSIIYFNNELGSVLAWDGVDGIKSRASEVFLNTEFRFNRSSKIRYSNTESPSASTATTVPGTETNIRFENVVQLLESIYPIGSVYINANNAANPSAFMGFGTWIRYGAGRAIFGFSPELDSQGNPDALFGINTSVVDQNGIPLRVAGNQFGSKQFQLTKENLPELESDVAYMRESTNGEINLSGCLPLPGADTSPLATYELANVKVNSPEAEGQEPTDITTIPPGITAYMWVRTA